MTYAEYLSKIKDGGINLERLNIVIGRKTNIPYSKGCYQENDIWYFYDVNERRVAKVLKFLRTYLNWIQNSVFEGEVTEAQMFKIKNKLTQLTDEREDSVIIFSAWEKRWLAKNVIGREKNALDNFI
jgi:CRISPR-associated protein Cas2